MHAELPSTELTVDPSDDLPDSSDSACVACLDNVTSGCASDVRGFIGAVSLALARGSGVSWASLGGAGCSCEAGSDSSAERSSASRSRVFFGPLMIATIELSLASNFLAAV